MISGLLRDQLDHRVDIARIGLEIPIGHESEIGLTEGFPLGTDGGGADPARCANDRRGLQGIGPQIIVQGDLWIFGLAGCGQGGGIGKVWATPLQHPDLDTAGLAVAGAALGLVHQLTGQKEPVGRGRRKARQTDDHRVGGLGIVTVGGSTHPQEGRGVQRRGRSGGGEALNLQILGRHVRIPGNETLGVITSGGGVRESQSSEGSEAQGLDLHGVSSEPFMERRFV